MQWICAQFESVDNDCLRIARQQRQVDPSLQMSMDARIVLDGVVRPVLTRVSSF